LPTSGTPYLSSETRPPLQYSLTRAAIESTVPVTTFFSRAHQLASVHDTPEQNRAFNLSETSGSKRGAYSPGFGGNGTESKPTLPSLDNFPSDRFKYRPSATSALTTATTSSPSGAN
jgi:hypothetical protein